VKSATLPLFLCVWGTATITHFSSPDKNGGEERPNFMSSQEPSLSQEMADHAQNSLQEKKGSEEGPHHFFWRIRLVEGGLILSMGLYYFVGNSNIYVGSQYLPFQNINPLYSLPLLLIFALLSWYRLPVAVALFPLVLPYCYIQKNVVQNLRFSLAEIALYTCVVVALLQYLISLVMRKKWPYRLSFVVLRERFGPFLWPMLIFLLAAAASISVAFARANALRDFREEVFGPFVFLVLAFFCLRMRQDLIRFMVALFGSGLLVAVIGCLQYFFFKNIILSDADGARRITAMYGSPNSIAIFFDYALPIGLALIFSRLSWKWRLFALLCCIPYVFVLYESNSRGALLVAIPAAMMFVIACAIRKRKLLLGFMVAFVLVTAIIGGAFAPKIIAYVVNGHTSSQGYSTALKRPLLWESALNMIQDHFWFGVGMDNWLCHYSNSWQNTCLYPHGFPGGHWIPAPPHPVLHAYWIIKDPVTGQPTGMADEPTLAHPHEIFLHVWVSIGLFGLLAFLTVMMLFYWTFVRLLQYLATVRPPGYEILRWIVVSVGASMLAMLLHGLDDNTFLAQDVSFCFWILVLALLCVRAFVGMPWWCLVRKIE
jgi:putative inorganic carbon (hco3(-)) transporter